MLDFKNHALKGVDFPLASPSAMNPTPTKPNRMPVLVVDDSPVALRLLEMTLPADEYKVIPAKSGQEAVELFARYRPALVITDWVMPDLSGTELCERIRSDFRDCSTYIILLTSVSEKSKDVKGFKSGADDYLTKPYHPEELLARVDAGRRIIALQREIEAKNRLLEQLALTDELTGLPNRRAIEQWATFQLSGAMRHEFPFCVVMADLDRFKSINDTHGHDAGDQVLKKFAEILRTGTRQSDIAGRLGGDEFLWILTFVDDSGVRVAVERIRAALESQTFVLGGQETQVTASFGIAMRRPGSTAGLKALLDRADAALYSAKRVGRNKIDVGA